MVNNLASCRCQCSHRGEKEVKTQKDKLVPRITREQEFEPEMFLYARRFPHDFQRTFQAREVGFDSGPSTRV